MPRVLLLAAALIGFFGPGTGAAGQIPDRSEPPGEVRGRVFGDRGTGQRPLPHVMLDVSSGLRHRTVATDSLGRYSASGLPPGRWRIQALHVGFSGLSLEVLVPSGGSVDLDITLTSKPISLPPVLVRAVPMSMSGPREAASSRDVGEVSIRALEGSSGMVESGLAQVVRTLPGGSNQAEPTDVLLMRGSAADLKLVLLDGAPIYTPFHLGGLVESFDPGALGSASLFLGGAPARFDGGLSYILDLQTRSPNRDGIRGEAAADLLTGRVLLEGPVAGGGFLIGTRMIHDLGTPALNRGDSPYGYRDLLFRGEWGEEAGPFGFLSGFWNQESVRLDLTELAFSDEAQWGNQAVSGGISGNLGATRGELRGAVSRYDAHLPVAASEPLFARSRSDRVRITGDISHPWDSGVVRVGFSLDGLTSDYMARGLDSLDALVTSELALQGSSGGMYAEATRQLSPSFTLRGGLRLDRFSSEEGVRVAPRGSVTWLLTQSAALTLAAGRYHQYSAISSGDVGRTLSSATDGVGPQRVSGDLVVGAANHLVVSLDQILAPGLRLGLEGYVKNFSGVTGLADERVNASGVDLRVAREGARTSGWLGYTLTWFWASEDGLFGGDPRFTGRHLLSAGLSTSLSDRVGVRLRIGYGDGLPYTSIPLFQSSGEDVGSPTAGPREDEFALNGDNVLNSAPGLAIGPDEGFLRAEVEVFGSWPASVFGRETQLRPYLRVLNALNRRDALFYHFSPWRNSTPRPLAELPILPLLGLEWIF